MITIFIITFAIFGIIFIPFILLFLIGGVDLKHKLGGAIAILIFWIATSVVVPLGAKNEEDAWNGGYCECGQHWELEAVTKSHNGHTTKYYVCPNCYVEITQSQ